MLSAICPLKLQKLAKKQNNLIVVSYCNLACLRRLMHFLITCKKAFAQFDSRTGHQPNSQQIAQLRGLLILFFTKIRFCYLFVLYFQKTVFAGTEVMILLSRFSCQNRGHLLSLPTLLLALVVSCGNKYYSL